MTEAATGSNLNPVDFELRVFRVVACIAAVAYTTFAVVMPEVHPGDEPLFPRILLAFGCLLSAGLSTVRAIPLATRRWIAAGTYVLISVQLLGTVYGSTFAWPNVLLAMLVFQGVALGQPTRASLSAFTLLFLGTFALLALWHPELEGNLAAFLIAVFSALALLSSLPAGMRLAQSKAIEAVNDELQATADRLSKSEAELLRASQGLARQNAQLDEFSRVVAHDLKAPMIGMSRLAEWIEEDVAAGDSEEVSRHVQLLRGRSERLQALVQGVLEYARAERGTTTPVVRPSAKYRAELEQLARDLDFEGLRCEFEMEEIHADPVALGRVLQNLVSNAIQHNHDNPELRVRIAGVAENEGYRFTVCDDGIGIPPEHLETIFVVFKTLKPRDEVEATGIGLSIVRKLTEAVGGSVSVRSEVGSGACFEVLWPRADAS